jgi:squalene-hopene/tetraprenyl-beta-curcumene cyclase
MQGLTPQTRPGRVEGFIESIEEVFMIRLRSVPILVAAMFVNGAVVARAADGRGAGAGEAQQVIDRALEYLKAQQQPDGTWQKNPRAPIAFTALVLRAFAAEPKYADAGFVKKGFKQLLSYQQADGSIHSGMLANYNTAVAVSALAAAKEPAYQPAIDKAVAYLKGVQWSDTIAGPGGQKLDVGHPWHGGWGYGAAGRESRPDLSNTAMVLEALKDGGVKSDDPAFAKAAAFVARLQNNSETNKLPWAGDNGGFIYEVGADGKGASAAGEYTSADGKPLVRSYGTMSYAGLKSMIYAGLSKDDPRVRAAWQWVRNNWTLDENPGMRSNDPSSARDGVFYYYQTFGKALAAAGQEHVADAQGNKHDWRAELVAKLKRIQRQDGSFAGERKWMEDDPVLATAFAVLALQEARGGGR